ncbi:MAG: hypothetical protein BGO41_14760 [Clostridiales bacterium 38-18]|nr:MAG: hypothetical protein BGO41_14760 [Clostridiales bacterium 38-18]
MIESQQTNQNWQFKSNIGELIGFIKNNFVLMVTGEEYSRLVKHVLISLEDDNMSRARFFLNRAKRKSPEAIETVQLERLMILQLERN